MGNPAAERRKLKEKRRKRHEQRVGPGTYLPKDVRTELQAELKAAVEAATKEAEANKTARAAKKKAKVAEPATA